ncbi:MAG: ATP-binding cassette domain-containing protein [Bacilli bacterium]|nr:ATP-binding cassette domain-containing protein [Bacilli bacterium]
MAVFTVKDVKFNYQDKELYKGLNFQLNPNEHACLVGVNGTGKTTLLNIITKNIVPDAGTVTWEGHITYAYLDQKLSASLDSRVDEYLYGVFAPMFRKEAEMNSLYEKSANPDESEANIIKYLEKAQKIQDELMMSDFYSLSVKINSIKEGLGIRSSRGDSLLRELSSGEREKIYLARMLLEEKDVLILDEPTNFLDQQHVKWLADYLTNYPNAFLVVSHDHAFLKEIANVVFCLENKEITRYKGDFDFFLSQHEVIKEQYEKNYAAQQRYIKKEEEFIAKNIVRATSAMAAKSHRARLEHLERMDAPSNDEIKVHYNFPFTGDCGERVLDVNNLEIGYNGKKLPLPPISMLVKKHMHIAILGKNGIGKTTFIKTILGKIPAISGTYKIISGTTINYFSQDEDVDKSLTPVEYLKQIYPDKTPLELRTILGGAGVKNNLAIREMNKLSGGEVAKTMLARMMLKKANMLVFDEPTNHLDQKAKEALWDAIKKYPGVVIIISHEKDFYDDLVDLEIHF